MRKLGSWHTRSSEVVYETPFFEVLSDEITMPNGKPGHYGWMRSKYGAVYVVPVTDNNEVILVKQQRYTIGSTTLECVAGGLDNEETHIEAAHRELLEETGYSATNMTSVFEDDPLLYPAMSKTYNPYKLYIATGLHKETSSLDEVDGIEGNVTIPLANIPEYLLSGKVVCSQSIASLFAAHAHLTKAS